MLTCRYWPQSSEYCYTAVTTNVLPVITKYIPGSIVTRQLVLTTCLGICCYTSIVYWPLTCRYYLLTCESILYMLVPHTNDLNWFWQNAHSTFTITSVMPRMSCPVAEHGIFCCGKIAIKVQLNYLTCVQLYLLHSDRRAFGSLRWWPKPSTVDYNTMSPAQDGLLTD